MTRSALFLGVTLGLARGPACGDSDSVPGGANAPCTRDKDCQSTLVCAEGVCTDRDAGGRDGGASDGAGTASDGAGTASDGAGTDR